MNRKTQKQKNCENVSYMEPVYLLYCGLWYGGIFCSGTNSGTIEYRLTADGEKLTEHDKNVCLIMPNNY